MSNIHIKRKKMGLCVCGKSMDREGYYCSECYVKYKEWRKNYVYKNLKEGKCASCAKDLDRDGWFCKECTKKLRIRANIRNAERREKGLCIQCGSKTDGTIQCRKCLDMLKERRLKKIIRK